MSRKLFEKVKEVGKPLKKLLTNNSWTQPSSNNSSSNFQREPKWKKMSLKKYAK